jgi:hypothetical protein
MTSAQDCGKSCSSTDSPPDVPEMPRYLFGMTPFGAPRRVCALLCTRGTLVPAPRIDSQEACSVAHTLACSESGS